MIQHIRVITNWGSILISLIAALYWYRASIAKITTEDSRHRPGVEMTYEDPDDKSQEIYVVASAMEQSRLNKIAAIFTAVAISLQAISSCFAGICST